MKILFGLANTYNAASYITYTKYQPIQYTIYEQSYKYKI